MRIIEATADQALASLEFIRAWVAAKEQQRNFADKVVHCLLTEADVTAADYAEALFTAEGLEFMHDKLVALYSGILTTRFLLYRLSRQHPSARRSKHGGPGAMQFTYRWRSREGAAATQEKFWIPTSLRPNAHKRLCAK